MSFFRILIFGSFTALTCSAQTASRPNVLVIVADDLGWAGVGFHNKAMVTPNLDRLAKEGAELQRFYVYPTCSPTRVALLTGQMPCRYNVISALQGAEPGMPAGVPTIASSFESAGYRSGETHRAAPLPHRRERHRDDRWRLEAHRMERWHTVALQLGQGHL